jgi:4-amino-4-deoxy-L-arabinose transferase-like glycosyltransferase
MIWPSFLQRECLAKFMRGIDRFSRNSERQVTCAGAPLKQLLTLKTITDFLSGLVSSRIAERFLFGLVLLLCAVANLPWHLDNYDQAKQAYVSYQIALGGDWWYQRTPHGDTATKPPLAGWLSLPFYWSTGSWDLAWRLPGYLCTVAILLLLAWEARRQLPDCGALMAISAFGLNLLTPRIASLVRTDMMLALWITICGWLIYRKIDRGQPWLPSEKWMFSLAMLAALLTKGPILYAFILPGMAAFWFLGPQDRRALIWSGWWTWLAPLALFAAWLGIGCSTRPEFYDDVVIKEFLSRFDQSLKAYEKQQPIWFYFPHLLHKFAPWSVLALALPIISENVRRKVRSDPATLWLACWAVGGLLCMTFVPSKRIDRIFPVIVPLTLLLVSMIAACQCGKRVRAWSGAAVVLAALAVSGYFLTLISIGFHNRNDALVQFGRDVQWATREAGAPRIGVVEGRDEAMVIYCDAGSYLPVTRAMRAWANGDLDALVIPERRITDPNLFPAPKLDSGPISKQKESRYLLFLRPQ